MDKENLRIKREIFKTECNKKTTLNQAINLLNSKNSIISDIFRINPYNDEPKIFEYSAKLLDNSKLTDGYRVDPFANGSSFNQTDAILKTIGEAIERWCLSIYGVNRFRKASYSQLKNNALDPKKVVAFSKTQLRNRNFKQFLFDSNSIFYWIKGYSLFDFKETYLPAQLVFVPYGDYGEPIIRFPITTGAACGTSLAGAIYRGICEIVERDAFMITYLNKLTATKIDLSSIKDPRIRWLIRYHQRYFLTPFIFDITTDIDIPVFLGILIDKSGQAPAVSLGLKCDFSRRSAISGCLEEACQSRAWIRDKKILRDQKRDVEKEKVYTYDLLLKRAFYWYDKKMIHKLDFLLDQRSSPIKLKNERKEMGNRVVLKLKKALGTFQKLGLEVYFVEVTTPSIKKYGFRVVKVVIPTLQPLYLEEEYPYLGGERLYTVPKKLGYRRKKTTENELNKIPHPFL